MGGGDRGGNSAWYVKLIKKIKRVKTNLEIILSNYPAIPFLAIYSNESVSCDRAICTSKELKKPRSLSIGH